MAGNRKPHWLVWGLQNDETVGLNEVKHNVLFN